MNIAEFKEIRMALRKIQEIVGRRAIHMRTVSRRKENGKEWIYDLEISDTPPPANRNDPWKESMSFSFDFPEIEPTHKILAFLALILTYDGIDVYVDRELFDPDAIAKKAMEEETNG